MEEAEGEEKERLKREWKIKNLEQQKKMMSLLEEFYQNRETPFDARLVFDGIGGFGGFRVQSFGAEIMSVLSTTEEKNKNLLFTKKKWKTLLNF